MLTFRPGAPRHEQLSDWLRDRIRAGQMAVHDQLPSEAELGELSGVSRITVRRALATLENEGRIYRRQGLGSFVAPPPLPQGLVRLTDFAQDMERAGLTASSRVLHQAPEAAAPAVAEALGIEVGAPTVRLDRLRLGDGAPVALDRTWLPPFYAQFLEGHDLTAETIYRVLERDFQIPVLRGHYRIEAGLAGAAEAEPLGVPKAACGRVDVDAERYKFPTGIVRQELNPFWFFKACELRQQWVRQFRNAEGIKDQMILNVLD